MDALLPERRVEPCAVVLFGATGDLARRKLIPALYNLARGGFLPAGFRVVGIGRSVETVDEFRGFHEEAARRYSRTGFDEEVWRGFAASLDYVRGDLDDAATFVALGKALARADSAGAAGNRLCYV